MAGAQDNFKNPPSVWIESAIVQSEKEWSSAFGVMIASMRGVNGPNGG